jgi:hypothetical protein
MGVGREGGQRTRQILGFPTAYLPLPPAEGFDDCILQELQECLCVWLPLLAVVVVVVVVLLLLLLVLPENTETVLN